MSRPPPCFSPCPRSWPLIRLLRPTVGYRLVCANYKGQGVSTTIDRLIAASRSCGGTRGEDLGDDGTDAGGLDLEDRGFTQLGLCIPCGRDPREGLPKTGARHHEGGGDDLTASLEKPLSKCGTIRFVDEPGVIVGV